MTRVLVVDDNHDIVLTMAELLRAEGHEAEACFGGKEATECVAWYDRM